MSGRAFPAAWGRFLRFAFWALYNPLAWTYDRVSRVVSLGHWADWQRTALPELSGTRVLELAFGTGDMLLEMEALRLRPVGLDLSRSMVRIAQRKLRAHGVSVPLVRGRAQHMPFAGSSFDALLCTFPAGFILDPRTLGEIGRVLVPGGRAVVVVMAHLLGRGLWIRVLQWLYRVTGQEGPLPDLGASLAALGLDYRTAWKTGARGDVFLAILVKRVDG